MTTTITRMAQNVIEIWMCFSINLFIFNAMDCANLCNVLEFFNQRHRLLFYSRRSTLARHGSWRVNATLFYWSSGSYNSYARCSFAYAFFQLLYRFLRIYIFTVSFQKKIMNSRAKLWHTFSIASMNELFKMDLDLCVCVCVHNWFQWLARFVSTCYVCSALAKQQWRLFSL